MNKCRDASNAAENQRISSLYRVFIVVCVRRSSTSSSTFVTKDHYIFYYFIASVLNHSTLELNTELQTLHTVNP